MTFDESRSEMPRREVRLRSPKAVKKDKKSELEKELEKAQGALDLKVGKEATLRANDGFTYIGTLIGIDYQYVILKNVTTLAPWSGGGTFPLKEYIKLYRNNISAQLPED